MHPETLNAQLEREPYVPVRLHLSDGRALEIRHPGLTFISGTSLYVFEPARHDRGRSRIVASPDPRIIALRHIVSIEPITPAAA
jgi:hypothetical protein